MAPPFMDVPTRFWSKVTICEHGMTCAQCCWLWQASRGKHGYGQFSQRQGEKRTTHNAQRISWLLINGEIPDGLHVLHNCPGGDNKACVNPQHLWLGTAKDNSQDALRKGQFPTGDRHGARLHPERHFGKRLSDSQVQDIRYLASHRMPYRLLASIYQVNAQYVGQIVRGNFR